MQSSKDLVSQQNFDEAETYLKDKVLDKPKSFSPSTNSESRWVDRQTLTVPELLLHVFGHIEHIPSQESVWMRSSIS